MKKGFFIGDLAKQAHVSVDTIRYYEKLGLLPKPIRTASGYRIYQAEALDRLMFIRQAQALNLSLAEIAEIVQLHNDRSACLKVQTLLKEKIAETDQRLATLNEFCQTLRGYLAECQATLTEETHNCCPVLEDIAHQSQPLPTRKKISLSPEKKT